MNAANWFALPEPFFENWEQAEAYIHRELPPLLPEGWSMRAAERLTWIIAVRNGENYVVQFSRGLEHLIFYYGNSDHGVGLHHFLRSALVLETKTLRGYSLADCVTELLANYKPNVFGLT